MTDVFISYSRRDSAFVQRLTNALTAAERSTWIDWADIPQAEDWWREIQTGIANADNIVCILTEHWLTSEVCHRELTHAREQNKRVFSVIRQRIEGDTEKRIKGAWMDTAWEQVARDNWDYLRHLHWTFFDDDTDFESNCQTLFKALDTDQPHIKAHTRYSVRAQEWERAGQNPSFLLTGDNLTFAEQWLFTSVGKDPAPTDLQGQYIRASRQAEDARAEAAHMAEQRTRRLRRTAWTAGIAGVLALIVTAIAGVTTLNATNANATSQAQLSTATVALATGTQVANRVAAGETLSADLGTQAAESAAELAQIQPTVTALGQEVVSVGGTLTQVPPTLTFVAHRVDGLATYTARLDSSRSALLFLAGGQSLRALALLDAAIATDPGNDSALVSRAVIQMEDTNYAAALEDFTAALNAVETDSSGFYDDDEVRAIALSGYHSQRALIYIQVGNYAAAQADLDAASALTPDDPTIISQRGDLALALGDYETALAAYNRAIALDSANSTYISNRAELYLILQNYEAAIADFGRAIELDPLRTTAYTGLAQVYEAMGDYASAIDAYSAGIAVQPDALLLVGRGIAYDMLDELDAALADFSRAIELEPNQAPYYTFRAGISRQQGDFEAALDDVNRAIELDPAEASYIHERARIYTFSGDTDKALTDYNRAIELAPPDSIELHLYFFNRGLLYSNLGDTDKALADYTRAIEIKADYALPYFNRSLTYLIRGQGEEAAALPDLDRYIELVPDDPDGYYFRALTRVTLHLDQRIPATPADLQAIIDDYQQAEALGASLDADDQSYIAWAQQSLSTPPTPTATPVMAQSARIGEQTGEIVLGGGESWMYGGQAGETLVIRVAAEKPAPADTTTEERLKGKLFDAIVLVYGPDGALLGQADIDDTIPQDQPEWNNPRLTVTLPVDGLYTIVVRGYADESAGTYRLVLEAGAATPS
ncbi:MAG: tetratricopeptide repeat protein [Anaerolineae bacterium]|nr:tetratricopeptide repeat protein [Anaerolineae bacterium]